jgi:Pyruvate/2-oxoacid:ferredoxin oxidoreductase delta subunit
LREEGDYPKVDYDHCKGCGICANECPTVAITMVREDSIC